MLFPLLNIVFPQKCLGCKIPDYALCDRCVLLLSPAPRETNKRPIAEGLFDYHDPTVRHAIWLWKYKGNREIARVFAKILYDRVLHDISDEFLISANELPLLIPIPLSFWRKRRRGFNQTEMLAKELVKIDGGRSFLYVPHALTKARGTKSQTSLTNRTERQKNLKNCFIVKKPDFVRRKVVILVDDVYTTGATLEEAAKTLRKAGVRKVLAYAIAH